MLGSNKRSQLTATDSRTPRYYVVATVSCATIITDNSEVVKRRQARHDIT